MSFTYEEVLEASIEYFNGNELAAKVFVDKYALRDNNGRFKEKTPDDMHNRLAGEFARIDAEKYSLNYDDRFAIYRDAINRFARICPQGSPMTAIGNKYQLMSASNCVVVASPKDNMGSIIDTGKDLAQLYKRRCGVGTDISTLRPEGMTVNNAARTTSGAWSFADFYSYITRMVGQQARRGALMITLSVHHPDVIKFATMKHDLTKVTGANISLRLSDEFLKAVENNEEYELRFPCEDEKPVYSKYVKARDVWDVIISSATQFAEPGLIMWQNMLDNLPAHCYPSFKTCSTNPCSEIALSEYDSCRLISINLTGYVNNPFEDDAYFDFSKFKSDISIAQQMADNLVDLELELIGKIKQNCEKGHEQELWQKLWQAGFDGRRTGLGTHGLADTLAQLCLKYDSDQALEIIDEIYKTLRDTAYDTSCDLARVRGSFPVFNYELEKDCSFIKRLPDEIKNKLEKYGRRNISLLTQAPTGSVSLLSKVGSFNSYNVSSGVEPVFRNSYTRRKKINSSDENARTDFVDVVGDKWQEFTIYHSNVDNYLSKFNAEQLPEYFITSDQINWSQRVKLQGVEQQYIDHSISSTINLPKGTSTETVGKLYLDAWKCGLKGVTVYVDGSRDGVLISNDNKPKQINNEQRADDITYLSAPKRPEELQCDIKKVKIQGDQWTFFIGLLNDKPYEVFGGLSKYVDIPNKYKKGIIRKNGKVDGISVYNLILGSGDDEMVIKDLANVFENATYGAFGRTISLALRHGVQPQYVVEQLSKDKYSDITSFSKVMSRVLKSYIKDGAVSTSEKKCSECGDKNGLVYQEGCLLCKNCGFSKCS